MTDAAPRQSWWNWRNVLLVASLGLNLIGGGAIATQYFMPAQVERLIGPGYSQLLPRAFLRDLTAAKRREIGDVIRGHRKAFQAGREDLRSAAMKLADAIEAEPFNAAAADVAVDGVGQAGANLIGEGSKLAREVLARLTPEERKSLARHLRARASAGKRK